MASFGWTVFDRIVSDISKFRAMSSKLEEVAFSICSSKAEFDPNQLAILSRGGEYYEANVLICKSRDRAAFKTDLHMLATPRSSDFNSGCGCFRRSPQFGWLVRLDVSKASSEAWHDDLPASVAAIASALGPMS